MKDTRPEKTKNQSKIHLNAWLLPILIGIFAVLYGLTAYRGWLIFLSGTSGAWLLALLWVHILERNLRIERKLHLAWATVGDSVPEQLKVSNHSWLPAIWVEIVDTSATLESPVRFVSDIPAHASRTRNPAHLFKRRGVYTLGPTRLRSGDPFGIYTLTIHDQHASTILITPPLLPLKQLKIAQGGQAGDERLRAGVIERDISDVGLRNYVPGDSLRRIHWRASAHAGTLVVRRLETMTSQDWWIYVDLDHAAQYGAGQDSTLELAIVLAASLAERGLKEHRRVGLALAGPKLIWLEPLADPAHHWRVIQALSMAEPGNVPLKDLLAMGHSTKMATMVLITPSTNPAWVAAAEKCHRGGSVMALLVNPADFGSPIDQSKIMAGLARSRIPFTNMRRSLLEEAYLSIGRQGRRQPAGAKKGRRYIQQERAAWQNMD